MVDSKLTPSIRIETLLRQQERVERLAQRGYAKWLVISALVGAGLAVVGAMEEPSTPVGLVTDALIGAGVVAGLAWIVCALVRGYWQMAATTLESRIAQARSDELQGAIDQDSANSLVRLNFSHLDTYYAQTKAQADKSFLLASWASVVGFVVIAIGIFAMFYGPKEKAELMPAYLTTSAGLVGEFIAAGFFYLYTQTVRGMAAYHDKLVLTQNVSLALKLAEGLPEPSRTETQRQLIEQLSQNVNAYLLGIAAKVEAAPAHGRGKG